MEIKFHLYQLKNLADFVANVPANRRESRARIRTMIAFQDKFEYIQKANNELIEKFGEVTMQMGDQKQYRLKEENKEEYGKAYNELMYEECTVELPDDQIEDLRLVKKILKEVDQKFTAQQFALYEDVEKKLEEVAPGDPKEESK